MVGAVSPTVAKTLTGVDATLAQRGTRYGDWTDNARISEELLAVVLKEESYTKLPPYMRASIRVILDKIARVLNGDPFYDDNWHDIQGYAKLAEDRAKQGVGR